MRVVMLTLVTGAAVFAGCNSPCIDTEPSGTALRFADPDAKLDDFLAHPWPSDARRRAGGGNLDLDAFPNPTDSSTLRDYVHLIGQTTRAYSTSAAMYLSFNAALDPSSLASDPMSALSPDASVQLIDIDPKSPERGRRFPLLFRYVDEPSLYLPAHHLIALPPFGVPLSGDTQYALIATSSLKGAGGAPVVQSKNLNNALYESCKDDAPGALATLLAPLRHYLTETTNDVRSADDIRAATVFTTQGAVRELRELAEVARAQPVPEVRELELVEVRDTVVLLRGKIQLPGFQHGDIPYKSLGDGGEIAKGADGKPAVDHLEETRVSFCIPTNAITPADGWPVVLYSHGTGGSYEDAYDPAVAEALANAGMAVVGYDQTLHGPRDPTGADPNLTFFNLFNPIAARDNIRQGSADLVAMMDLLESGLVLPGAVTGVGDARFDSKRIAFLGHSQGSLVGSPFLATEDRVKAVAFSGLGAILTITLQERKDIVDFKVLLESLINLPPTESLDDWHPVLNLIQTFIEPADPISYARSYVEDPFRGARFDVIQVEGFKDFASPPRGQEAFASAAHIPLVAPAWRVPSAAMLMGPAPQDAPASANVLTRNGEVTFGLIQYPEETHFPIFENAEANTRYVEFLRSALYEGRARILPGTGMSGM